MKCKACGIKRFPMWYSEEYCSRSCVLQRLREIKTEFIKLRMLINKKDTPLPSPSSTSKVF